MREKVGEEDKLKMVGRMNEVGKLIINSVLSMSLAFLSMGIFLNAFFPQHVDDFINSLYLFYLIPIVLWEYTAGRLYMAFMYVLYITLPQAMSLFNTPSRLYVPLFVSHVQRSNLLVMFYIWLGISLLATAIYVLIGKIEKIVFGN